MERLGDIERRVANLAGLLDVVSTMRAIAAARTQQARQAVPHIRAYAAAVDAALVQGLALLPALPQPAPRLSHSAVLLIASEHGFVGTLNERLLREVQKRRGEAPQLLVIGARGVLQAAEHRLAVAWQQPMASTVAGALALARTISEEIYRRIAAGTLDALTIVYARSTSAASWEIVCRALLPFDPTPYRTAPAGQPPLLNLPPEHLVERLVDEFVLAELARAVVEALASENVARVVATELARSNIEQRLGTLRQQAGTRRQEEITTELLEIVAGGSAVAAEG